MTVQDVDPETYYVVGKGLFEKAGKLYDAFNVNVTILGDTRSMAGTDDAGKAWATSYDERVRDVLGAVNDLTKAMENYGGARELSQHGGRYERRSAAYRARVVGGMVCTPRRSNDSQLGRASAQGRDTSAPIPGSAE